MMMICDPPQFYEEKQDVLLNPNVIVEVLSSSTEAYDREVKFPCYVTLPSVHTILLVEQKRQCVEVYRKDSEWGKEEYETGNFTVEDCTVNVEKVYRNTNF